MKKNNIKKEYNLYMDTITGERILILGAETIEEMDNFTKLFIGPNDMVNELNNIYGCDYKLNRLVLISGYTNREEPILYRGDQYKADNILMMYRDYLLEDKRRIDSSLIRVVKNGISISSKMSDSEFGNVFRAYYNNSSYKKIRDTYFELLRIDRISRNVTDQIINSDFEKESVFSDERLASLVRDDDYEGIYGFYDLDDMSLNDIRYLTRDTRGRK